MVNPRSTQGANNTPKLSGNATLHLDGWRGGEREEEDETGGTVRKNKI